jgi:hypothetical protein
MVCIDNVLYKHRGAGYDSYEVCGVQSPCKKVRIVSHIDGMTVNAIAKSAFKDNVILEEIVIPSSVESIYAMAFYNCENLKKVTFYNCPNSFSMILCHPKAFMKCGNLQEIVYDKPQIFLPAYRKSGYEFAGCVNLMRFDGYLGHLTNSLFADCPKLETLTFWDGVEFDRTALDGCDGLKTVTFLGQIKTSIPKNIIEILQTMNIKCTSKFNYFDWAYDGANVEVVV